MSSPGAKVSETKSIQIEMEISINAAPSKVWDAFVSQTDAWWLADFRATGEGNKVVFEQQVGGRLFEDAGDGHGLLWFTVLSLTKGESMHLSGMICPPFGGPATTTLYIQFMDDGAGGTTLKVTDSLFGRVDENAGDQIRDGWQTLFGDGLKAHVETLEG